MQIQRVRGLTIAVLIAGALFAAATASAAPPANDNFANATPIDPSSLPYSDPVTIDEATMEVGTGESIPCGFSSGGQTVWYSMTPTSSGVLRVSDSAGFYYQFIGAYRQDGSDLTGLTNVACATWYYGENSTNFSVEAGKTYYIQVGSTYPSSGGITLTVDLVPPPANDDFAKATTIGSLPFSDSVDSTAAGLEANEPTPSCASTSASVWYAFSAAATGSYTASLPYTGMFTDVALYTGPSLANLNELSCRPFYQPLTFHANAGTTYYFQVSRFGSGGGTLRFELDAAPAPTANFSFSPGDPSTFDTVQFSDGSYDPAQAGFSDERWEFGDGASTTNPGSFPTHRYSADGTYTVKLTVTTTDGRMASTSRDVLVKTHDVSIAKVTAPQAASVGQTRTITVGLTNSRYAETVQVQLLKSIAGGGWQQVGVLTQYVPVRSGGRTTSFDFSYTLAPEDAQLGKVNFQAVATIEGGHDAVPTDNTFVSLPTKVKG